LYSSHVRPVKASQGLFLVYRAIQKESLPIHFGRIVAGNRRSGTEVETSGRRGGTSRKRRRERTD
jgi:hypothetical protein